VVEVEVPAQELLRTGTTVQILRAQRLPQVVVMVAMVAVVLKAMEQRDLCLVGEVVAHFGPAPIPGMAVPAGMDWWW
jgi:hypothetical protein